MKIVEIITQLSSGGAERFTVDLCNELSKNNEVTLIVIRPLKDYDFYVSDVSPRVKIISMNSKGALDISVYFDIVRTIHHIAPDIVHLHLGAIIYAFFAILTLRKIKFFYTVHNEADKDAKNFLEATVRRICFKCHLVTSVTISIKTSKSFIEFYHMKAPMIFNGRDVPSDIEISQEVKEEFKVYKKNEQTKVLLCIARFSPVKRQGVLAKVVSRLVEENYNLSLLFIGNTTINGNVLAGVLSYNCNSIYVLGERKNPLEYLKMSDAFCLCSEYEGLPISLIEAMGAGAIPVCTPVGGIVDIIDNGVNGVISDDLTEDSYYDALKYFFEISCDDIGKMRNNVLKSYEPFSMTVCAKNYTELFSKYLVK